MWFASGSSSRATGLCTSSFDHGSYELQSTKRVGHRILYCDFVMGFTLVLIWDPCAVGLTHMGSEVRWQGGRPII